MENKQGILIGVVGFAGSGKDTVADLLIEQGFIKDSFAKTLKDTASALFDWPRDMLDGTTDESRKWREQVDPYWSIETGDPEFTPRKALQLLGTEAIRETFSQDFWVSTVVKRYIGNNRPNTVITDCRFPNEINAIRKQGGKIIHVARGNYPRWHSLVTKINQQTNDEYEMKEFRSMLANKLLPHVSEYAWIGQKFDIVLYNNGTLDDLRHSVNNLEGITK